MYTRHDAPYLFGFQRFQSPFGWGTTLRLAGSPESGEVKIREPNFFDIVRISESQVTISTFVGMTLEAECKELVPGPAAPIITADALASIVKNS